MNNIDLYKDLQNYIEKKSDWIYNLLIGNSINIIDLIETIRYLCEKKIDFFQLGLTEWRKLNIIKMKNGFMKEHDELKYYVYIVDGCHYLVFANVRDDILIPLMMGENKEMKLVSLLNNTKNDYSWLANLELTNEFSIEDGAHIFNAKNIFKSQIKEINKYVDFVRDKNMQLVKISSQKTNILIFPEAKVFFLSSTIFE